MSALTYVIFILVAVTACLLGAVGAYFYYQARHREAKAVLEALDQDISEREEKLHRLQFQLASSQTAGDSDRSVQAEAEIQRLRQALEQKQHDYDLLKHDFDLEIDILKKEVEQIRNRRSDVGPSQAPMAETEAELLERGEALRGQAEALRERAQGLRVREKLIADRELSLSARERQIDEEISARRREIDNALAEREKRIQADALLIEEERTILARAREVLAEKESRIDAELIGLPTERFTREQEAVLIKRLRQQNKLQRDELEKLHREVHRAKQQLATIGGAPAPAERATESWPSTGSPHSDKMAPGGGASTPKRNGGEHAPAPIIVTSAGKPNSEATVASMMIESAAAKPEAAAGVTDDLTAAAMKPEAIGSQRDDSAAASSKEETATASPKEEVAAATPTFGDTMPEDVLPISDGPVDDLTRLAGVDARIQRELYRRGITTFDQIARWSSSEVGYIAEHLKIDRKTIQDHWIVNAQSQIFTRDPSNS